MNKKSGAPYPLILLLSSPRAGSHLLERLLLEHYGIAFPLLTHLVSLFDKFRWLWGDLSLSSNRCRLLKAMYQYEALRVKVYALTGIDSSAAIKSSLLCTQPFFQDIVAKSFDFSSLVSQAHQKFALIHHGNRWGYNLGFYSCPKMTNLPDIFDNSRVIHVVRDGRDVALSWTGVYYGPYNLAEGARIWQGHVQGYKSWGEKNSDRYHQVRYEDILDNPDRELERIENFLGISPLKKPLDITNSPLVKANSSQGTHKLVGLPVQKDNKEKWKKTFSSDEIELFNTLAGETLTKFGYSNMSSPMKVKKVFWIKISQLTGRFMGVISPIQISKIIRTFLPIFFFVFGRFYTIPRGPRPPEMD